jgi:hypothetical protein
MQHPLHGPFDRSGQLVSVLVLFAEIRVRPYFTDGSSDIPSRTSVRGSSLKEIQALANFVPYSSMSVKSAP